jgi:hypothetical protein
MSFITSESNWRVVEHAIDANATVVARWSDGCPLVPSVIHLLGVYFVCLVAVPHIICLAVDIFNTGFVRNEGYCSRNQVWWPCGGAKCGIRHFWKRSKAVWRRVPTVGQRSFLCQSLTFVNA